MDQQSAQSGAAPGNGEKYSPFKPPNEEQVFIQREAEKQKKKEAKEAAKHLRIWDKKTATSRMPLKRVKDTDILPAQNDESLYNFNVQQRGYISAAVQIAKSRVQFTREQRPQNINEFIDQKKDMFLVELAHNTIVKEIDELQKKKDATHEALEDSKNNLQEDSVKLIEFIEKDQSKTEENKKQADDALQERKVVDHAILQLNDEIQHLSIDIEKNKDQLRQYEGHKEFLMGIYELYEGDWFIKAKEKKDKKVESLKEIFIASNMEDASDAAGSMGMSQTMGSQARTSMARNQASQKAQQNIQERVAFLTKEFQRMLDDDLHAVPKDFYDEELFSDDVEYISSIFSQLEDKNLKIIKKMQEAERQLEQRKADFTTMQSTKEKEIGLLQEAKASHLDKLDQGRQQLAFLKKQSQLAADDGEGGAHAKKSKKKKEEEKHEPDIHALMIDIEKAIQNAHNVMDGSQPLDGKEPMDLLQEIELNLLEWRKTILLVHKEEMAAGTSESHTEAALQENLRRQNKGTENMELAKELQRREKVEQDKRTQEKNKRVIVKLGKKQMTRDSRPAVEKKQVEKPRPQFEKAFQAYLQLNLEEHTDLAGTDTYKEGLVNPEWNDDATFN